jgi:hypothetical protein
MVSTLRSSVGTAVRDTVPFFVITLVWTVIMLVFYGLFLAFRPAEASYGPAIHASAFVPPFVGFLGHTLRAALRDA